MFKLSKNIFKNVFLFHKIISSSYNPKLLYSDMCKVYEKSFQVHPVFGNINLKSNCYCIIQPADSQLFPDSNHVQVVLWRKNVEAIMENAAALDVENLESDDINITSSKGSVKAKNIKTEQLSVAMKEASLSLDGAFQGNLNVNAKKLNFRAKRLQGTNLFIQASSLETDIESSYMTNGNIFAERGNLNIRNLHGSTYLHLLKGNLSKTSELLVIGHTGLEDSKSMASRINEKKFHI
ncbi:hypothetical protein Avbf_13175 [Armadillidium vulgare]|nr:hypothetical protein Avbf_13175 [Armadillidium vulgare]